MKARASAQAYFTHINHVFYRESFQQRRDEFTGVINYTVNVKHSLFYVQLICNGTNWRFLKHEILTLIIWDKIIFNLSSHFDFSD